jgi:hypothetical protein
VFRGLYEEVRNRDILEVLMALYKKGATLLTTNYDDLLDKACGLPRIGRINRDDTPNTNVEYASNALSSN